MMVARESYHHTHTHTHTAFCSGGSRSLASTCLVRSSAITPVRILYAVLRQAMGLAQGKEVGQFIYHLFRFPYL